MENEAKFDSVDIGWIMMSIGMAIGAGIVFLPVQVGLVGIWVFLLSSIIGYPAMYLFQRMFINSLASAPSVESYPDAIESYLGKNAALFIGVIYFVMIAIWLFVYTSAINNDLASYLQSFEITKNSLSNNPLYTFLLLFALFALSCVGEKRLFKLSNILAISVLFIIMALALLCIPNWRMDFLQDFPPFAKLAKNTIITLPFTLTSILFIQSLSPMVISYRAKNYSIEIARKKALRAMNAAFLILFVVVFFYAISFTLTISQEQAKIAFDENISALAIIAKSYGKSASADFAIFLGIVLNIFAVLSSFFGVLLAFNEGLKGLLINLIDRRTKICARRETKLNFAIFALAIALCWLIITLKIPVIHFTIICSPIFGIIGCLVPAYLILSQEKLKRFKNLSLYFVILIGIMLCISPFLAFL